MHILQEMDVLCVCSSNATMLPQHYTMDATNTLLMLGPLFPEQNLTCSTGDAHCTPLVALQESVPCMSSLVLDSLQYTHVLAQPDIRSVMALDDWDDGLAYSHVI